MISFSSQQIELWLASVFWPFVRILAIIASGPVLGHRGVPVRVKIGLAMLTTAIVAPSVASPMHGLASAEGFILLVQQILIGVAMGFTLRVIIAAVELAGELIGFQMGLNFSGFFDPSTSTQGTPIGSWLGMLVTLMFLALNGHLVLIYGVAESFRVFPMSIDSMHFGDWGRLAALGAELFRVGVYVALPVLAALLVCNLGLGVLARVAPQLNIFAVGFSVTLLVGFLMLALSLPFIGQYLEVTINRGAEMMLRR